MYRLIILSFILLLSSKSYSQENIKADSALIDTTESVFTMVENPPSFQGGEEARMMYLMQNVNYPLEARSNGIEGTVYVTFVVEKDGTVSNVRILRGIGGGCDEEVIRLIKGMPKWNPGTQRGKAVRVQFNMPVKFTIGKAEENNKKRK